eukprot:scaffold2478_cov374-Prasinococcus_capsulatus_cf.AAC.2
MVTMLAPSPDWITGVSSVDMCDRTTGEWRQTYSMNAYPVDAGTDSGMTFMAEDMDTNPREPIALLGEQFGPAEDVMPVAYVSISAPIECEGSVPYKMTFDATWSAMSHPQAYVASAHWSPPVVAAHSDAYTMWELGGIATPGIELVAETGSTSSLTNELKAVQGSTVGDYSVAGSIGSGSGTTYTTVTATPAYSSISMVSMIAPSPDWIVGVSGIDMCDRKTGLWKQAYSTYVYPVDAGTDNGLTLTAPNSDNTPHDPIAVLGQQFGPPEEVNPMGYDPRTTMYVPVIVSHACGQARFVR